MKRAFLLDLDGTFFFKGELISGAVETLNYFRDNHLPYLFLTNTDGKTTAEIAKSVRELGLPVKDDEIFNPISALNELLAQEQVNAHCLVSDTVKSDIKVMDGKEIKYVVIGDFSDKVSYENINIAFQYLMDGCRLLATQKGKFFIRDNGYNIDTGGFVALFEYSSGQESIILGKPSEAFFGLACKKLGVEMENSWVVGDDIFSDIKGGLGINATTVLVQTGKYSVQKDFPETNLAQYSISSIANLPELIEKYS